MADNPTRAPGEKLQTAILTFLMTGGGFALVTLIFVLFLNPGKAGEVARVEKEYQDLTALLSKPEKTALRAQAKLSEGQANTKTLSEVVNEALTTYQLDYGTFAATPPKAFKAGLDKVDLEIPVKPAKLLNIMQFMAAVRDAKKTIQVESATITRDRRALGEEDDSWSATVHFVDYISK